MTMSFIGSAFNTASTDPTVDVSATGRIAGDMIVLIDHAYNTLGAGIPANVVPAGFTQIDTQTVNPFASVVAARATTSWKISAGTEGVITGMAPDAEHDFEAMVFRSTLGWGPVTSPVFDHEVTTNLTIAAPGANYIAIGVEEAANSTQDYAQSPTENAQIFNTTNGDTTVAYTIFNSAPVNVVLTGSANRELKQGFAVSEGLPSKPFAQQVM